MKQLVTLILSLFFSTLVYSQSVPSYVPTNGLVGWWGFNGNAQDGSGNGNHGTVNGATLTTDRFGSQNGAYSFDGDDDYILANAVSLDNVFGNPYDVTVSVWFYYMDSLLTINNGHPPIGHQLIGQGTRHNPTAYCDFAIGATRFNGTSQFAFEKSENPHPNHSMNYFQNNFQNNTWYHVVFTFNSGQGYFYLNGQIAGSFFVNPFLNGVFENCGQTLSFGSRYVENSLTGNPVCNFLLGKLDDIGIWNRALTPQEITNLYNAQTCQVNITSQPTSQTSQLNNSINFSVTSSDSNSTYRWQTDTGGGFFDLNDGGQYSGASMSVLTISAINLQNHNQSFRCIVSTQNCGSDTSDVATLSVPNPNVLTGTLNYANSSLTPLPGVPVHLRSYLGYVVGSDTTDSLGVFALRGYPNGNYFLDAEINYSVNSVNSSDALQTQRFVVLLEMLNNLQQKSADVSGNQRVTSNDALMIRLLSAGVIGQFPVDNFVNTQPSVTFAGDTQSVQILTLASGDVNGNLIVQYNPPILVLDTVFSLGDVGTATVRFPVSGSGVFERGICWGTSPAPTIQNDHVNVGSGGFDFSHSFDGLTGGSTYFVRAYARNPVGIFYSNEVSIIAASWNRCPGTPTVTDIDGNMYNTVQIGNQCWMQSNLKVSRYRNGDTIPTGLNNAQWGSTTSGAYSIYGNIPGNDSIYGKLYNHFSVMDSRGLCPTGWHVPSDVEWTTLTTHLGGRIVAGGAMKSTTGWASSNTGATNSSGFTGLPGGGRFSNGGFSDVGNFGYWWSSSDAGSGTAWYRFLYYGNANVTRYTYSQRYGFSVRCVKNTTSSGNIVIPTVTTDSATGITSSSATLGGNVTQDGGSPITARGVAYGLTSNPTTSGNITTDGSGVGTFGSTLSGLTASTTYYVRAYATNGVGTAYGNEISFSTNTSNGYSSCGGVTDVDGNSYQTVQIGTQCWTQSNLKVSKYRNGDNIPTGLSNSAWQNTTAGAFAIYDNNPLNDGLYGKLYNHFSVMDSRGLCPTGWHVPSDVEWTTLTTHLGGAGGVMKSTTGWTSPNTGATNSSGFTGLPGGYRHNYGGFSDVGYFGNWWSSSGTGSGAAWSRVLVYYNANVYRYNFYVECIGFSVRCIRD